MTQGKAADAGVASDPKRFLVPPNLGHEGWIEDGSGRVIGTYMLVAIQIEERDLVAFHGGAYARYRDEVSMILPLPKRGARRKQPGVSR